MRDNIVMMGLYKGDIEYIGLVGIYREKKKQRPKAGIFLTTQGGRVGQGHDPRWEHTSPFLRGRI